MSTPHRVRRAGSPFSRAVAAATTAVLALTGALALGAGPLATSAAAQLPQCPAPGEMPNVSTGVPIFTDSNVAVWVGGNYSALHSAAESEGVLVVEGDATFDAPGNFSIGAVGAGSQIAPPDGSTMLHVGGDMSVGGETGITVGSTQPNGGGVNVGGTLTIDGSLSTTGASSSAPVQQGIGAPAALAPWADFRTVVEDTSATIASWGGTAVTRSGNQLTFTGSGTDDPQVFTIPATLLDGAKEMYFVGIPDKVSIAINVTGTEPVDIAPNYWSGNGTGFINDFNTPGFGNWAARTLWNFVETPSLSIGRGDQFLGTILAPAADATISTATNGRVIVGGDLSFGIDGLTTGLEMHSYPWTGPGPFTCLTVEPGGFTVAKRVVGDGADLVPAGTQFAVAYSYTANGTPVTGTLTVTADGTVVDGPADLPAGTVVTLSEPDLPGVPGVEWGTPSFSPSGTVTIGGSGKIAVTLTNTASAQVGGFSIAKALTGLAAGQVPADTEFTVAYTVTVDGTATQGTMKVLADGTVVDGPQDLPVGAVVTFTEIDLPVVPGVVWGAPSFDPASVTIADGESSRVTLTNTADAAVVPVGGFALQKVVANAPAGMVPADTEFTVAYSYELDGAPLSGTLTVRADGAVVDGPQNLPAGTVVTFGEVSLPDVDGVVWGAPVFSPASLVVGANENAKVTLTNTAEEARAGGFSMAKSVTGEAADQVPAGTEFTVRYAYDLDGVPTTGTMTVKADGTVVDGPQNLREGTVVTFEEIALPAVDGVVWGTPVFSPASLVIGADEKAAVTLTNTALDAPAGGFSLAKAVTGLAADTVPDATEFTVRYTYDLGGVTTTGTLAVTADGTVVDGPQNLPVGTVVTFTELAPPSVDGVVWGTPVFSPASVTIADGENALVTVTNTANAVVVPLGGFSMAKELTGEAVGRVPAGTEFTATYEYTIDGATLGGTLTLPADGRVVDGPQNLVAGTVVTFTEITPAHVVGVEWGTPVFSPASVTIGSGENTAVTLTNTANLAVGTFSVAKVVTGEAAGLVPAGTSFTVEYSYEQDGQAQTGTLAGLTDGTSVPFPGDLVEGTVVTLGEVNLPDLDGVVWGTPVFSPDVVTIGADETVEVTLTNTASTAPAGGFSLAKTVVGETAGQVPGDTAFTVTYSYDLAGTPTTGTATVTADGTVVDGPQNLPVGTVVTFDEIDLPSIDGVVWGTPVFSPATVTVADGENTAVTLTNTANAEPAGGFSLTKVVEGSGASVVPAGTEFTAAYSYELDGQTVAGTVTVLGDGSVVDGPQNLPVGTVVTFTEIDLPAVAGVVWGTPVFSPAQVTVADGENAAVTLTNTADVVASQVGGFTITKVVEGKNAAKVPADTQFTVAISGTVNGEHTEGTLTVRADGTVVEGPANLPARTVVDLAEVDLPKIAGVSWGTPVFTVGGEKVTSVTIGAGETVAVTLTNTADSGLAATGAGVAGIAAVALLLVGGGGALLVGARRRRA
ncbi:DUF5979 domain-containing protein [Oerskovia jenensis]|uniref:Choice-of-anchor A domain-containing protein n=1 Tax=Oerskovia jenensis TaxID=162169 RepID=A0ABS2LFC2_9CELL|nr:DUF5979 domain-containing protein [Oerskovia jenensis]MBM7479130.1 choice-of-anchor A domain-containing protein [Oerskovia jenensis]